MSNRSECDKAIQETYRNEVVRYLRKVLKAAYPETWQERLRKPFKDRWNQMERDARESRARGVMTVLVVDSRTPRSAHKAVIRGRTVFAQTCRALAVTSSSDSSSSRSSDPRPKPRRPLTNASTVPARATGPAMARTWISTAPSWRQNGEHSRP